MSKFKGILNAAKGREPEPEPESKSAVIDSAPPQPPPKKTRVSGKRSNPDYSQTTIYINKKLHNQMKAAFLEDGYEGDFSDWVEERAREWLSKR